ncbi:ethyl tert-butyl ether degradation protein EthD [Burkholderia sp. SRS-W-2-2016]|uniref:EthD family reductase n=1 Tax=Burkholderia sp. SRS-W-2-2016 TaxID=1926878 RepID=UPI00094AF07D|nr:EthD family reductase [Burkholderia sp. SRS-W-2-2016]OLL31965.1 ethyl tert-butyl ether degradation protein EthD [Burkholderia sp. SRS-W-2-2016]
MQVCLFLIGASDARPLADIGELQRAASAVAGLRRLIVHEPIAGQHDARIAAPHDAPSCVLQWYFDGLTLLEAALDADGAVMRALQAGMREQSSPAQAFTQQVMAVRKYAPSHASVAPQHEPRCTYLVAYEGVAQDFNAWLTHYLEHHRPLMLQLPALRELEVYTRIDSRSALPFAPANAMQRNKVVFDDASALTDALASPIRDAMRRDFHALPPYSGATPHFAMHSIYGNLAAY